MLDSNYAYSPQLTRLLIRLVSLSRLPRLARPPSLSVSSPPSLHSLGSRLDTRLCCSTQALWLPCFQIDHTGSGSLLALSVCLITSSHLILTPASFSQRELHMFDPLLLLAPCTSHRLSVLCCVMSPDRLSLRHRGGCFRSASDCPRLAPACVPCPRRLTPVYRGWLLTGLATYKCYRQSGKQCQQRISWYQ